MSFLESFSEDTQDQLKKSMLKCSLLFSANRSMGISQQRKEFFLKTVFSIIVSEDKVWTEETIFQTLERSFMKKLGVTEVHEAIKKLLSSQWIKREGEDGFIPHEKISKRMKKEIETVENRTHLLIQQITKTVQIQSQVFLDKKQQSIIEDNIKDALNLYFRLYGIEYVFSEIERNEEDKHSIEVEDLIRTTKKGLSKELGDILVNVLAEIIENPTQEQAEVLMLWVKAYIGTQVMRLDPQLSQLQTAKLEGKIFVLDTDFLLYSLTNECRQSFAYKELLKALRKAKCKLIIPHEVITEVVKHAQYAEGNYRRFKTTLHAVDRAIIEEKATNIFVKDFCLHSLKKGYGYTLKQYLRNYLDEMEPVKFIEDLIYDELHIKVEVYEDFQIDNMYSPYHDNLKKLIYNVAKGTEKDLGRDEDEAHAIADTDARLYLSVLSLNKDVARTQHTNEMLQANSYLVTNSTRSIKCAKELNIYQNFVTRPALLINLFSEIGDFEGKQKNFANLFDNPFLAYIVDENWSTIKKLAESGVDLKGKKITRLNRDLDEVMHRYLTNDADQENIQTQINYEEVYLSDPEKYIAYANELNNLGYKLIPSAQGLIDKYNQKEEELAAATQELVEVKEKYNKKEYRHKTYLRKTMGLNLAGQRKKHKRK